jgi:phage tail P2-like protein
MIKEILPYNLLQDDAVEKIADAVDEKLKEILSEIPLVLIYSRIDELSENILDLLAWQFHVEGYELAETDEEKRAVIKKAIELHRYKGTKWAVKKALENIGITAEIVEWFESGGTGEPFTFNIKLSFEKDVQNLNSLISLINEYKNVRSQPQIDYEIIREIGLNSLSLNVISTEIDGGLEIDKSSKFVAQNSKIFDFKIDSELLVQAESEKKTSSAKITNLGFGIFWEVERNTPLSFLSKAFLSFVYPEPDRSVFSLPIPPIERKVDLVSSIGSRVLLSFGEGPDIFHVQETQNPPLYFSFESQDVSFREQSVVNFGFQGGFNISLNTSQKIHSKSILNIKLGG